MTTDRVPKTAFAEASLRRGVVRIAGLTKRFGHDPAAHGPPPGFVVTDAAIPPAQLRAILKRGVERSYNRVSVDGDTSTNDTLVLLANGASGVRPDARELPKLEQRIVEVLEVAGPGQSRAMARVGASPSPSWSRELPIKMPRRAWRAPSPLNPW